MSREIKFRIWDKDNEMFDYINLYDLEDTLEQLENIKNYFSNEYFEEIELQQYTGLKDKNGKEIYEGDIVNSEDYLKGKIIYGNDNNNYSGCWLVKTENGEMLLNDYRDEKGSYMEVIGNIYENKELIE